MPKSVNGPKAVNRPKSVTGPVVPNGRTERAGELVRSVTDYEAWVSTQVPVVAAARTDKHDLMAADPFGFLRATYFRWLQRVAVVVPDPPGPVVTAVGDLHVENFGTWRDAEGRLVWGVNDLDEADRLPAVYDLLRLVTSALLAQRHAGGRLAGTEVIETLLDSYPACASAGGRPVVLDQPDPLALSPLLPAGRAGRWWPRLRSAPVVTTPDPTAAQLLDQAFPPQARTLEYRNRPAGMGSRDHLRIVAIADVDGAPAVREIKALGAPASWWIDPHARQGRPSDIARALLAQGRRSPDPALRIQPGWVIRRLAPWSDRIELADLHRGTDAAALVSAMGAETANLHLTGATPADLRAFEGKPVRRWLVKSAARMIADTVSGWQAWRAAVVNGAVVNGAVTTGGSATGGSATGAASSGTVRSRTTRSRTTTNGVVADSRATEA